MQIIRYFILGIEDSIAQKDEQLELDGGEYVKWTNFRVNSPPPPRMQFTFYKTLQDVIQDQNSAKIVSIKETLQHMQMSEAELQGIHTH